MVLHKHCSFCKTGAAVLHHTTNLKPLLDFNFDQLTAEFIQAVGEQYTPINLTKFLCGIYAPVLSKLKVKKLPYFGALERYPFKDVKNWITENKETSIA